MKTAGYTLLRDRPSAEQVCIKPSAAFPGFPGWEAEIQTFTTGILSWGVVQSRYIAREFMLIRSERLVRDLVSQALTELTDLQLASLGEHRGGFGTFGPGARSPTTTTLSSHWDLADLGQLQPAWTLLRAIDLCTTRMSGSRAS